jgi:phosphate transport system protein
MNEEKKPRGHTMHRFDQEMEELHRLTDLIDEKVRRQLMDAVETLRKEDADAARAVINRDEEINDLDVEADDELIRLIAKRQPVAKDLRDIMTVGKIVTDLERVGDEARKIARLTIHLYDNHGGSPNSQMLRDISRMAEMGEKMVADAMACFKDRDLEKAVEVIKRDFELRDEFKSALRHLSTFIMEDSRSVGHMVEIVLALRALERIGGHGKNIAGYVIYLVTGRDVRHADLNAIAREIFESGKK